MLQLFVLLDIFKHPVTAHVVLVSTGDAKKTTMVTYYSTAELGNVVFEIHKIFRLLMSSDIIKMNVFVTPFKIVDDSLISQFFLHDENVLKEINNPFFDIKMVKFSYHCLLVFEVTFVLVY